MVVALITLCSTVHAQVLSNDSYSYDAMGQLLTATNAAGHTQLQSWDRLGRLLSHTNPLGQSTQYHYSGLDQPDAVMAAHGAQTQYQNSGLGHTDREISPDRGQLDYQYDSAGNLIATTDARGVRVEQRYDVLNRLTERKFYTPTNTLEATHTFTWDGGTNAKGRLSAASNGNASQHFSYDSAGRLSGRTDIHGAFSATLAWQYIPTTGQFVTLTYPSGAVLSFEYDTHGRLASLTWAGQTVAGAIEYAPFGPPLAWTLTNGLRHQRTQDQAGRIRSYTLGGETHTLHYDAAGRIVQIEPQLNAARQQTFGYDAAGRLTDYSGQPGSQQYGYDANGNRLDLIAGGSTQSYLYTPFSNRLDAIGSAPIGHDAAGNRITDGRGSYLHDSGGRLVQFTQGLDTTHYDYNTAGERIAKISANGDATHFVYDQDGKLLGEYAANGQARVEYAWLGDIPVAVRHYGGGSQVSLHAVEADHLGTPRLVTDAVQTPRWRWHSAPFGDTVPEDNLANRGAVVFNLRFPGQYYDQESGLHYNYFRDYEPLTGRYVQSDPIGLEGEINTYAYVNGNPMSYTDPLGNVRQGGKSGQWWEYTDRNFQRWFHQCVKQLGDSDATRADLADAYAQWIQYGKPNGKNGCGGPPPPPVPTEETCGDSCKDNAATVVVAGGAAYIVYRCIRMIPSLFPPLWSTIPANVAAP